MSDSTTATAGAELPRVYTEAEVAELQSKLRATREEAKGHRLNGETAKQAAAEAATKLAEATTKHTEALTAAEKRVAKAEIKAAAVAAGMNDPLDALLMVAPDKIKRDADGEATNLAELVEALRESKPYLFGAKGAGAGTGSTTTTAKTPGTTPPGDKKAADMTPAELAAFERQHGIRL